MGLVKCPDCKKRVSDQAEKCIHCGCPLSKTSNKKEEKKKLNKNNIAIIAGIVIIVLIVLWCLLNIVKVPVVKGLDVQKAKEKLVEKEIVPKVIYKYNSKVEKDQIIKTSPAAGKYVKKRDKVKIYISKGPKIIEADNATIEWHNVSYLYPDNWEFRNPYIEEGDLIIECEPTFGYSFSWDKEVTGQADLTDKFNAPVPIKVETKEEVIADQKHNIKLTIPLSSLYNEKPTNIYVRLYYIDAYYKEREKIDLAFNIVWKN